MPHRVTSFFRNSTENLATTTAIALKSAARRRDSGSRTNLPRRDVVDSAPSYASSISDDGEDGAVAAVRMGTNDTTRPQSMPAAAKKHHRLTLPFGRSSRESHESASAGLSWNVESPPIVFYGDAENSTGALVSGQLFLNVKDEWLEVDSFEATLNIHVVQKRPFQSHCHDCANQYTQLKKWTFLSHPTTLQKGVHQYPFSILLGGHLPATVDTPLMSIAYEFKAEAVSSRSPSSAAGSCYPIKLEEVFVAKRSITKSDLPHQSVRVFPPTNIKAAAHYDMVVYPNSTQTMTLRLDGLVSTNSKNNTLEIWRVKKIGWRLEETIKTIAPACEKHAPQAADSAGSRPNSKKGIQRAETRGLGERNLFEGWKSNYAAGEGMVEFEFEYGVQGASGRHHGHATRFACDSKSQDGSEVAHTLMVEMVVSKEWAPVARPHLTTQTGTGRILRMHYAINLSEISGLGVSWDNEAPPLYQDVPPSPPTYPNEGPIEYDSLEALEAQRSSVEALERVRSSGEST